MLAVYCCRRHHHHHRNLPKSKLKMINQSILHDRTMKLENLWFSHISYIGHTYREKVTNAPIRKKERAS